MLIFGACGLSLAATTTTHQPLQVTTAGIEHSCAVVVGFHWLPRPRPPINRPPQLLKSSARAHFRRLWPFSRCHHHDNLSTVLYNCRNQAFVLVFSRCRLPLAATTITRYQSSPTTAEIEHSCSFSVVAGFL